MSNTRREFLKMLGVAGLVVAAPATVTYPRNWWRRTFGPSYVHETAQMIDTPQYLSQLYPNRLITNEYVNQYRDGIDALVAQQESKFRGIGYKHALGAPVLEDFDHARWIRSAGNRMGKTMTDAALLEQALNPSPRVTATEVRMRMEEAKLSRGHWEMRWNANLKKIAL